MSFLDKIWPNRQNNIEKRRGVPRMEDMPPPPEVKRVVSNIARPGTVRRRSQPSFQESVNKIGSRLKFIETPFLREAIPVLRKLTWANPDVSQAHNNIVLLTASKINIEFGPGTPPEKAQQYKKMIEDDSKKWLDGGVGLQSIAHKAISQAYVGGAVSAEIIVKPDLLGERAGIDYIAFVNPEEIWFAYNKKTGRYTPYQQPHQNNDIKFARITDDFIKLNPDTYYYCAINGDTDHPNGIPPYLPSPDPIDRQASMLDNIDFVMEQLGLLGFLDATLEKPMQLDGESDDAFLSRCDTFLREAKERLITGFKEGITVGFEEEHNFDFHSTTKNVNGVDGIFNLNEQQIGSAIKQDMSLLGRDFGASESQITVVFNKLISEITHVQEAVANLLHKTIVYHLALRGARYDYVKVEFNEPTIHDEYKKWQGIEVKARVLRQLRMDGIIDQNTYAQRMVQMSPYMDGPDTKFIEDMAPSPTEEASKNDKREKSKDASDRKGRRTEKRAPKNNDE